MTAIPNQSDNPNGLHQRYEIRKLNGRPVDPMATYFVLRLDNFAKDGVHLRASRAAARVYAGFVQSSNIGSNHLEKVGEQLQTLVDNFDRADGVFKDQTDKIDGYLLVGINGDGQVVINLDYDRVGHLKFSPAQARTLAELLLRKATEAESK